MRWLAHKLRFLRIFRFLNPFRYIKKLDWYIIKKFLGYYFFSIALIISIAIVFDFNENLSKFTEHHAPARAIIFDYYANFVPYFANSSTVRRGTDKITENGQTTEEKREGATIEKDEVIDELVCTLQKLMK